MRKVLSGLAVIVALAGCSSSTTVGSQQNLNGLGNKGQGRLGNVAPSTTPSRSPAAVHHRHAPRQRQQQPTPAASTQAPVARTTTPAPAHTQTASFRVKIVPAAQGYDPVRFQVAKGTRVVIVNTDKVAHTFTADQGLFNSGSIKPGKQWSFVAAKDGSFSFHDDTRPFATGQMLVYG